MDAILTKSVSFKDVLNRNQFFPIGTAIKIDLKSMVAYASGVHFLINPNEFNLIQ